MTDAERISELTREWSAELARANAAEVEKLALNQRITELQAEVERLQSQIESASRQIDQEQDYAVRQQQRAESAEARCKTLEGELESMRRLCDRLVGDHNAPEDCYSTGPLTGTPLDDLCPSCEWIKIRAALSAPAEPKENSGL